MPCGKGIFHPEHFPPALSGAFLFHPGNFRVKMQLIFFNFASLHVHLWEVHQDAPPSLIGAPLTQADLARRDLAYSGFVVQETCPPEAGYPGFLAAVLKKPSGSLPGYPGFLAVPSSGFSVFSPLIPS